ncbi:hypothetical protein [Naumannella huperziae]
MSRVPTPVLAVLAVVAVLIFLAVAGGLYWLSLDQPMEPVTLQPG